MWFEFGNDLHGSPFGGTGNRTTRKSIKEQTKWMRSSFQGGADDADQVVHITVGLDLEELLNFNGTRVAVATEIVAQQIDDHQVLSSVLGAGRELLSEAQVFRRVSASGACTFDWRGSYVPAFNMQELFGGKAEHRANRCSQKGARGRLGGSA